MTESPIERQAERAGGQVRTPNVWLRLGLLVAKRRLLVLAMPTILASVVIVTTLYHGRQYTATGSFTPRSSDARGGLGALASQFGVNMPAADPTQSPDFFADLVRARVILEPLADTTFTVRGARQRLTDVYDVSGDSPAVRREHLIEKLDDEITVNRNLKTGIVSFDLRAPDPRLAMDIANTILAHINDFNLRTRQAKATAELHFVEDRLATLRSELDEAEGALLRFNIQNRSYDASPSLQAERARLERVVSMRQQVYSTLAQSYEQARIDAVRNTPVITVVSPPEAPVLPDSRRLVLKTAAAIVGGLLIGLTLAVMLEGVDVARSEDPAVFDELARALRTRSRDGRSR